ncbi:MAG: hypothetical protein AB1796_05935 [Bacillota bacterium]
MPCWGWALVVLAVIVIVPIKLKILKKILEKNNEGDGLLQGH